MFNANAKGTNWSKLWIICQQNQNGKKFQDTSKDKLTTLPTNFRAVVLIDYQRNEYIKWYLSKKKNTGKFYIQICMQAVGRGWLSCLTNIVSQK